MSAKDALVAILVVFGLVNVFASLYGEYREEYDVAACRMLWAVLAYTIALRL